MTSETLGPRALNRATLQRQHLLERSDLSVETMVAHLVGMQAQNPLDPYYGLCARLSDFDPQVLAAMVGNREMVRGQFMRGTIHLFGADDALAIHRLTQDVLARVFGSTQFAKDIAGVDVDAVLATGRALMEERPRTRAELADELATLFPGYVPASLAQAVTYMNPLVQVPPRGVWGMKGPAAWTTVDSFLGRPYGAGISVDDLVIRYLAAFGPAAVKDMRVWSGLTGLREVFDRLRPRLRTYRDENGAELFDLADIVLPDPDTPAPPRLLPEYDNVLLGHSDRTRFFTGDVVPRGWVGNVLVEGVFAGSWKVDGPVLAVAVTPAALGGEEALHEEASRLAGLAWPDSVEEVRLSTS